MKIDIPVFKIRVSVFIIGLVLVPFLIGLIKDIIKPNNITKKGQIIIYEKRVK